MCVCVSVSVHVCMSACMCAWVLVSVCVSAFVHVCAYICVYSIACTTGTLPSLFLYMHSLLKEFSLHNKSHNLPELGSLVTSLWCGLWKHTIEITSCEKKIYWQHRNTHTHTHKHTHTHTQTHTHTLYSDTYTHVTKNVWWEIPNKNVCDGNWPKSMSTVPQV